MRKSKTTHPISLDQEEKELLTSFEKGEWKTVSHVAKEKKRAQKTAVKNIAKKCSH